MSKKRFYIILVILLLGIFLRSIQFKDTFTKDGIEFPDTDPYYHVIRTIEIDRTFPSVSQYDPDLNYPKGQRVWPGGMEFLAVTIVKVLGFSGDLFNIKCVCALFPLLLFLLSSLVIYCLTQRVYFFGRTGDSKNKSLLSLAFLAVLPQSVFLTTIGKYDHHIFESLFLILSLFMASELLQKQKISKAITFGLIFGIMPFFWVQSPIFLAFFAIVGFLYGDELFALTTFVAFITYFILVSVQGDLSISDPNVISIGQPLIALVLILIVMVGVFYRKRNIKYFVLLILPLTLLILFRSKLVELLGIIKNSLLAGNPFVAQANESYPLGLGGIWTLHLDYSFVILPSIIFVFFVLFLKRQKFSASSFKISIGYLSVCVFFLLVQRRFQTFFLGIYIVFVSELILVLKDWIWKKFNSRRVRVFLFILLFIAFFPVSIFRLQPVSNSKTHSGFSAFRNACLFLKEYNRSRGFIKPGVLTKWDYGHWVRYYCDMPTVVSPLTSPRETLEPYIKASRLFYIEDMDELHNELSKLGVKFVMAIIPVYSYQALGEKLGMKEKYISYQNGSWAYQKPILSTLNGRLSFLQFNSIPPWLRIIYISPKKIRIGEAVFPIVVIVEVK